MDAGRGAWRGRGRATPARKDESAYLRRGLQHQAPLGHAPARHCPHEPVLLHLVLLVKPKVVAPCAAVDLADVGRLPDCVVWRGGRRRRCVVASSQKVGVDSEVGTR
jgi:hypothetical protein